MKSARYDLKREVCGRGGDDEVREVKVVMTVEVNHEVTGGSFHKGEQRWAYRCESKCKVAYSGVRFLWSVSIRVTMSDS